MSPSARDVNSLKIVANLVKEIPRTLEWLGIDRDSDQTSRSSNYLL